MGIPMDDNNDNIHAPTVASGPTSVGGATLPDLDRLSFEQLNQEKQRVEEELTALSAVLSSHGVTMRSTLTTFDGYPRDDIDVAQVRQTRVRIIHLRNDHRHIMVAIEKKVTEYFEHAQPNGTAGRTGATATATTTNGTSDEKDDIVDSRRAAPGPAPATAPTTNGTEQAGPPFARVNSVVTASPADRAGLKAGDLIRSVGSVNWLNHERLTKVAEVVQGFEGRVLVVRVSRKDQADSGSIASAFELELELTPRRDWGGRGLLGCHLVPL